MHIKIGETSYSVGKEEIKTFMKALENYNAVEKILRIHKSFKDIENNYREILKWAEEVKFLDSDNGVIEIRSEDYKYTIRNKDGEYKLVESINIYNKNKVIYENIDIKILKELVERYIF